MQGVRLALGKKPTPRLITGCFHFPFFALLSSCLNLCTAFDANYLPLQHRSQSAQDGVLGQAYRALLGSDLSSSAVQKISSQPRAYVYSQFLTTEECDTLIHTAEGAIPRNSDLSKSSSKNLGTFLRKYQDAFVRSIEDRISDWIFLPRENSSALKVLRYNEGQVFDAHYDYFDDNQNTQKTGGRAATFILFLSDVKVGGEIVFPNSQGDTQEKTDPSWTDCGRRGVAVKPKKGDALFFFHLDKEGYTDNSAEYQECPVVAGKKWAARKFVHVQKYMKKKDPKVCVDEHAKCADWASAGECTKNVGYMVGDDGVSGNCRLSCKVCEKKAAA